jgi:hypothetical protein
VQEVINSAKPNLFYAMLGTKDFVGGADRDTFIIAAHHLFEALSKPGNAEHAPESVPWDLVLDHDPSRTSVAVMEAVDQLVKMNLLTYEDPLTVSLHARVLKWAYLEVRGKKEVQLVLKTAKGNI